MGCAPHSHGSALSASLLCPAKAQRFDRAESFFRHPPFGQHDGISLIIVQKGKNPKQKTGQQLVLY